MCITSFVLPLTDAVVLWYITDDGISQFLGIAHAPKKQYLCTRFLKCVYNETIFIPIHHSIIIFDAAYEAFIEDPDVPHSIYEIEGAKEVAIEVRSYSKSAGFTAVRCGYTIVPMQTGLNAMWLRRQCTKYNGTAYVAQRAAEATYTQEGRAGIERNLAHYKDTAQLLSQGLRDLGYEVFGGKNAPYIWSRVPQGYTSWSFFDHLLNDCQVVCTPGAGFGPSGEGYVRFSAFSNRKDCEEALKRMKQL